MTRLVFIRRLLRLVYGGQPTADSNITDNLVNVWLNDGIALAAKQNYKDAIQIDGIGYINNSFYTTFRGLSITTSAEGQNTYEATLPQIPLGIGHNEGIASVKIYSTLSDKSHDLIPVSENQLSYIDDLPEMNGVLYWNEGKILKFKTSILLYPTYYAIVRLISGGDSSDLNAEFNVPDDYIPIATEYVKTQLLMERKLPQDVTNDGRDN